MLVRILHSYAIPHLAPTRLRYPPVSRTKLLSHPHPCSSQPNIQPENVLATIPYPWMSICWPRHPIVERLALFLSLDSRSPVVAILKSMSKAYHHVASPLSRTCMPHSLTICAFCLASGHSSGVPNALITQISIDCMLSVMPQILTEDPYLKTRSIYSIGMKKAC